MSRTLRIAIAQLDFLVGDIRGNVRAMIDAARRAGEEKGARLVVFPELGITGYPPEDLLFRADFLDQVERGIADLAEASASIAVVAGAPVRDGGSLYNAALYFNHGRLVARYYKMILPNREVFDEMRYFTPGRLPCVVELEGVRLGLTICEDVWHPQPVKSAAQSGAHAIINVNASPFCIGKHAQRLEVLHRRVQECGLPVIYVNQCGGQDELVFDGASRIVSRENELLFLAPEFEQGLYACEVSPRRVICDEPWSEPVSPLASVWKALRTGLHDYIEKNGFEGVVLGLSGGVDSALTLVLAVEALGADRVTALMIPSRYTSPASLEDARRLTGKLGVSLHEIDLEPVFRSVLDQLRPLFSGARPDTAEENIQARIRGMLLMAVSNKRRLALLATGNKSEMAVGYATLYGDMAGAFAPLKDVVKTMVYDLARFCNEREDRIPLRILERPPSAELIYDQTDQDSLPPYEVLDAIIESFVEGDASLDDMIKRGLPEDAIAEVQQMILRNEYKRRQAPIGIRITEKAFGKDRRYPVTSAFNPAV